ncbi:MAG: hypothetical protein HY329_11455 [Chloroflexi bacterium]|nr:hypothetical protein [Chloroflexota bacterium]
MLSLKKTAIGVVAASVLAAATLGGIAFAQEPVPPQNGPGYGPAGGRPFAGQVTPNRPGPRFGTGWSEQRPFGTGTFISAIAQRLELTVDALRSELRAGKSLADLAASRNVGKEELKAVAAAAVRTHLDAQVAAGTITRERADAVLARTDQAFERLWSHTPGAGRPATGRPGPRGGVGPRWSAPQ